MSPFFDVLFDARVYIDCYLIETSTPTGAVGTCLYSADFRVQSQSDSAENQKIVIMRSRVPIAANSNVEQSFVKIALRNVNKAPKLPENHGKSSNSVFVKRNNQILRFSWVKTKAEHRKITSNTEWFTLKNFNGCHP